jgi:hypothetical protein
LMPLVANNGRDLQYPNQKAWQYQDPF